MMISSYELMGSKWRKNPLYLKYLEMSFHERKAYRVANGGPPPKSLQIRDYDRGAILCAILRPFHVSMRGTL